MEDDKKTHYDMIWDVMHDEDVTTTTTTNAVTIRQLKLLTSTTTMTITTTTNSTTNKKLGAIRRQLRHLQNDDTYNCSLQLQP